MDFLKQSLNILCDLVYALILIRVVLSWFQRDLQDNTLTRLVHEASEPLLAPLRRILPRLGMLDLSPLVLIIMISIFRDIMNNLL